MEAWWMHAYWMEASRMLMIVSCVAHSGLAKGGGSEGKDSSECNWKMSSSL